MATSGGDRRSAKRAAGSFPTAAELAERARVAQAEYEKDLADRRGLAAQWGRCRTANLVFAGFSLGAQWWLLAGLFGVLFLLSSILEGFYRTDPRNEVHDQAGDQP